MTSGNDTPSRDPTDWAIQGSNDGVTWTDIYRFYDTVTPWGDTRNLVVKFTLPVASSPYSWIRYILLRHAGHAPSDQRDRVLRHSRRPRGHRQGRHAG
ncbi:MAG: hypothetical protein M5U12_00350 [Verrucomicrobia bacterium]|nr:hypothetical protein [Verrucomicrobiota bacterium]